MDPLTIASAVSSLLVNTIEGHTETHILTGLVYKDIVVALRVKKELAVLKVVSKWLLAAGVSGSTYHRTANKYCEMRCEK